MTAATSQKNKHYFGIRFKNDMISNSRLLIVNIVLSLTGLPLGTITALYSEYLDQTNSSKALTFSPDGLLAASVISFFITMGLGLVVALHSFSYQFKKRLTDMNYALPLNNRHRFFADYLSGLCVYAIPPLCAALLSLGCIAVSQKYIDEARILLSEHLTEMLLAIWVFLLAMVLFYTVCVLALNFAGSTFEAIFSCISLNVIIPSVIVCTLFNVINSASFGLDSESVFRNRFLNTTSPVGALIYYITTIESDNLGEGFLSSVFLWSLMALISIFIYIAIAYIIYKIRKAEDVSKPYVFKWYYYIILFSAVYCFLTIFFAADTDIIPGIVISAILWFVLEVVTRRGFKRIWVGALCFAGAVSLAFGIWNLCSATKGFGITKYVPSKAMVADVTISMNNGDYSFNDVRISDRQIIADTVELHSAIIDRYAHPEKYSFEKVYPDGRDDKQEMMLYDAFKITISYSLRNGTNCTRKYICTSDMTEKLLTEVLLSDEYAENKSKSLYRYAVERRGYLSGDGPVLKTGGYVNVTDKLGIRNDERTLSEHDTRLLADAYKKDLMDMTAEDLKRGNIWGSINGDTYFILDSFDNTISVLTDIGYYDTEMDYSALGSEIAHTASNVTVGLYPKTVIYAHEDDYYAEPKDKYNNLFSSYYSYMYDYYDDTGYTVKDTISLLVPRYNYRSSYQVNASVLEYDSDLLELFDRATFILINDKIAGTLEIDGRMYFIPDEGDNAELVQRVYNSQFSHAISSENYYRK